MLALSCSLQQLISEAQNSAHSLLQQNMLSVPQHKEMRRQVTRFSELSLIKAIYVFIVLPDYKNWEGEERTVNCTVYFTEWKMQHNCCSEVRLAHSLIKSATVTRMSQDSPKGLSTEFSMIYQIWWRMKKRGLASVANYPLASDTPSLNCSQSSALPGAQKSWSQSPVVPNTVKTEMNKQTFSWRHHEAIFRFFLYFKQCAWTESMEELRYLT